MFTLKDAIVLLCLVSALGAAFVLSNRDGSPMLQEIFGGSETFVASGICHNRLYTYDGLPITKKSQDDAVQDDATAFFGFENGAEEDVAQGGLVSSLKDEVVIHEDKPTAPESTAGSYGLPGNTVSQDSLGSTPQGTTPSQNNPVSSPQGGIPSQNNPTPSPQGGTPSQNNSISSPQGSIPSQGNPASSLPNSNTIPIRPVPVPVQSPSNLQLALFAHMAYFPFDFNSGQLPSSPQFTPFQYRPFVNNIVVNNQFGFDFFTEMQGWYLYTTATTSSGFSATVYTCQDGTTVVLAIRGSYGDFGQSLMAQSGTWWCNFRSMQGYRHSHIYCLVDFLHMPNIQEKLSAGRVYITGHSLGGYLAYVAAYEMSNMGLERNLRRVVVFSAPMFDRGTQQKLLSLFPITRNGITHFYVPGDHIAGAVGVGVGPQPGYGGFQLLNQLLQTMENVRGTDIPPAIYALNSFMTTVENFLPFGLPGYATDIIWLLNGAMGAEALEINQEFRSHVRHVPVEQTWFTPRPEMPWSSDASIFEIVRNYTPELMMDIILDMLERIFDTDTHFMMNFYSHLAQG